MLPANAASSVQKVGQLLGLVWRLAAKHRRLQLGYLALLVCAQCISLCQPLVVGAMLNAVQESPGGADLWPRLWPLLGLFFGVEFGFWAFHFPARVLERTLAFHVRVAFREELTRAVCELPVPWHRRHHSGETIDQVGKAALALHEFSANSFLLVYLVLRLTGPVVLLTALSPVGALVAFLAAAAAMVAVFRFDRVLFEQYRLINSTENTVASAVQDFFTNILTVISLRLETQVVTEVVRRSMRPFPVMRRNFVLNEAKWFLVSMLVAGMAVAVLGTHAYFTLAAGGALLAGTFFKLVEYLRRVGDSFYQLAASWSLTLRQSADVYGALHVLEAHAALERLAGPARLPDGWKRLELSGVSFVHEDETRRSHHLREVSLTLERGKMVALVGASGSGKSTLLGVLRGLHQASAGRVVCDGAEVPHGLRAVAKVATLFPQEPEIFSDSVRFNVTFGLEADEARIHAALDAARFTPVLERLPKGLDTNVAEKGVNLSGGERQRLALARGLHFSSTSEVLLLDEATSSVDAVNEQDIYRQLKASLGDRCLLATIHKLHLLEHFDRVYVLGDGEILGQGTVASLKASLPEFRRMWEASASLAS